LRNKSIGLMLWENKVAKVSDVVRHRCDKPRPWLFLVGGLPMGVVKTTRQISSVDKNKWIREHCLHCPDFLHKQENAESFSLFGGEAGIWDWQTCYTTCWQDIRTKKDINDFNYYHRKVGAL